MAYYQERSGSVRVTVRLPGGGRDTQTFDTRAEAEAWAEPIEAKKKLGTLKATAGSGSTVKQLLETFEMAVSSKTDSSRWNSLRIKKWTTDPIAKARVVDVTTHDINQWIERGLRRVSGSTVSRELTLLSSAFNYALHSLKWIKVNPCHGAMRPEENPPRDHVLLSEDELKAIRVAAGMDTDPQLLTKTARAAAAFFLGLETGMRSGEILRLKPRDYYRDQNYVRVTATERGGRKGSRSGRIRNAGRDVPLTKYAKELLDALMKHRLLDSDYIVGLTDGQRDALWRKARDRSGVDRLTFHDSKHEACTRLSVFLDPFQLSHAIGTKDIKLLRDTYYSKDVQRAVAKLPDRLVA